MFLAFCFCFMLGVGCFSFVEIAGEVIFYLFISIFIVSFGLIIFWSSVTWRFILFGMIFFVCGGLRFLLMIPPDGAGEIKYFNGEKVKFIGKVVSNLGSDTNGVRYTVAAREVVVGKNTKSVQGNVLVDAPPVSEFVYGDKLKISCVLQSPKTAVDSNFRYDKYLARNGIWSVCYQAEVNFISANKSFFNKIIVNFFRLRQKVETQSARLWPEPESSLLSGILYGARSGLPATLLADFNRVGITHIIAVSGYNISIIAAVLLATFIRLGVGRRRAFWAVIFCIIIFVLFSGASASVVRAGIMGVIVLIAGQIGRLSRVGNVLAFTAALMILANPFILIWDAGFQLSFLATLGLVYVSPLLGNRPEVIKSTISAIIATLPLILFQFGRLSLVAPLVNVLVLWIIPYLMLFGFLAIIFSYIFFPLGQVVAWFTLVGLKYLVGIANWFGARSWSAVNFSISLSVMVVMYVCIVFIVLKKYDIIHQRSI